MNSYILSEDEAVKHQFDGFGKTKSPDGESLIQIWIKVRKDAQIPAFDAIIDLKYNFTAPIEQNFYTQAEEVLAYGGMFVEDALKLRENDIFHKALKKAIINYFGNTGQSERVRKATENVICSCRHVTDYDIRDAVERGHNTFEKIQMATGAAQGCSSCENKVKSLISQPIKTVFGAIK